MNIISLEVKFNEDGTVTGTYKKRDNEAAAPSQLSLENINDVAMITRDTPKPKRKSPTFTKPKVTVTPMLITTVKYMSSLDKTRQEISALTGSSDDTVGRIIRGDYDPGGKFYKG